MQPQSVLSKTSLIPVTTYIHRSIHDEPELHRIWVTSEMTKEIKTKLDWFGLIRPSREDSDSGFFSFSIVKVWALLNDRLDIVMLRLVLVSFPDRGFKEVGVWLIGFHSFISQTFVEYLFVSTYCARHWETKPARQTDTWGERCSTSYFIRKMQIKTMRYYYTPIRMAKIQNNDNSKCWRGCGATGTFLHWEWESKMKYHLGRHFDGFLEN
jgi:hypothetical protein